IGKITHLINLIQEYDIGFNFMVCSMADKSWRYDHEKELTEKQFLAIENVLLSTYIDTDILHDIIVKQRLPEEQFDTLETIIKQSVHPLPLITILEKTKDKSLLDSFIKIISIFSFSADKNLMFLDLIKREELKQIMLSKGSFQETFTYINK